MNNRILIINAEIQKALSEIITYELNNPKITGLISVVSVDTTSDLDSSKVLLSIYTNDDKMDVFNQIKHSATHIRRELARKVKLRKVPYLHFHLDNSFEINAQMSDLIKQIKTDEKASDDDNN